MLPIISLFLTLMLFASRSFEQAESSPLGLSNLNRIVGLAGAIFLSLYYLACKSLRVSMGKSQLAFFFYLLTCLLSSFLMSSWVLYSVWKVAELAAVFLVSIYVSTRSKYDSNISFDFYEMCLKFFLFLLFSVLVGLVLNPFLALRPPVSEETIAAIGQVGLSYQLYGYLIKINANSLGAIAAIVFYVYFVRFSYGQRGSFVYFVLIVSAVMVVLAQSRTAMLALSIAMLYFFVFAKGKFQIKTILLSSVFLATILFSPDIYDYLTRGASIERMQKMSGRAIWWSIAIEKYWSASLAEQILGFGFMTGNREILLEDLGYSVSTLHSDYVDVLISNGLLGIFSFIGFIILMIVLLFRIQRIKQPLVIEVSGVGLILLVRSVTGTSLAIHNFFLPIAFSILVLSWFLLKKIPRNVGVKCYE